MKTLLFSADHKPILVHENIRSMWVTVSAPVPQEVENDSQAKALSREAAIAVGHAHLLNHVLQKRARSKKTLAEAEIPSLELQGRIRAMIKGAHVRETRWDNETCWVTLSVNKRDLKVILKKS